MALVHENCLHRVQRHNGIIPMICSKNDAECPVPQRGGCNEDCVMLLEVCGIGRWGLERLGLVAEAFTSKNYSDATHLVRQCWLQRHSSCQRRGRWGKTRQPSIADGMVIFELDLVGRKGGMPVLHTQNAGAANSPCGNILVEDTLPHLVSTLTPPGLGSRVAQNRTRVRREGAAVHDGGG